MAKNLTFNIGKQSFAAGITKVDRNKVYGYVEVVVTDKNGNICISGNLLEDGQTLFLAGATALKTVNDQNQEVDKKSLKTLYMDGSDAVLIPSSYDGEITLQESTMDDLFNLEVTTVYQLTWEDPAVKGEMLKALEGEKVYRFVFNYRADYEGTDALVISTPNDVFVLSGRILSFDYLENISVIPVNDEETLQQEEEDVDFGML